MEFKKTCTMCKNMFIARSTNARYCFVCRKIMDRQIAINSSERRTLRRQQEADRRASIETLETVAAKAIAAGMSYGQYVARYGGKA